MKIPGTTNAPPRAQNGRNAENAQEQNRTGITPGNTRQNRHCRAGTPETAAQQHAKQIAATACRTGTQAMKWQE